jgi:hypothetical protein
LIIRPRRAVSSRRANHARLVQSPPGNLVKSPQQISSLGSAAEREQKISSSVTSPFQTSRKAASRVTPGQSSDRTSGMRRLLIVPESIVFRRHCLGTSGQDINSFGANFLCRSRTSARLNHPATARPRGSGSCRNGEPQCCADHLDVAIRGDGRVNAARNSHVRDMATGGKTRRRAYNQEPDDEPERLSTRHCYADHSQLACVSPC